MSRKPLSFTTGVRFETDDGRPARFIADVRKKPYNITSRGGFSYWFSVPKLDGDGYENAYVDANGYGPDGPKSVCIKNASDTRPDGRPPRDVIDTTKWVEGVTAIPLTNGKTARFEEQNDMKPVSGRGERFQIVGSIPSRFWFGRSPLFWNDDGTSSHGRAPDIDTKKVKFRKVES